MLTMPRKPFYFVILLAALVLPAASLNTFAQVPYRVSDRQVTNLLRTLEQNADIFNRDIDVSLDRSRWNGTQSEDEIRNYIRDFEEATDRLKERFESRASVSADVEEVLFRAANIDRFLRTNLISSRVNTNWSRVRGNLGTLAGYYNVAWNWTNPPVRSTSTYGGTTNSPYRVSDAQVRSTLQSLERNSDIFSRGLTAALDRSTLNGTRYEDEVANYVRDYEEATDRLRQRFENRVSVTADVQEVLNRAANIDRFLVQNRLNNRVNADWNLVRTDLSNLANQFNVAWNWNNYPTNNYPTNGNTNSAYNRLNGTYRLDTARSANVSAEIDRILGGIDTTRRERIRRQAERRLESPDELAIERNGRTVSLASTNAPRVTFEADGSTRTEQMPNGRSMSINANIVGDQLVLNYTGDRMNDYYVAFNPTNNGNGLRVTRRIYLEGVNQQITVDSFYTRTSEVAQFDTIYRGRNNTGTINNNTNNVFVVPNGTRLTAVLNTDLNTKTSQVGDRFTMEVRSPNEYNGAIIEGRVASVERSGRVSGRARLGMDFDTIRLRDGRTYRFAGFVDQVRATDNANVQISNEGEVREGDNQTNRTVTRTAIGAALGALLGAVIGGGEGAAIGAGVGAGAGAGSVILQGRDDLELRAGTEMTVSASSPRNVAITDNP